MAENPSASRGEAPCSQFSQAEASGSSLIASKKKQVCTTSWREEHALLHNDTEAKAPDKFKIRDHESPRRKVRIRGYPQPFLL